MNIKESTYLKMLDCYSVPPPESGGILGMKNDVVCEYFHDNSCRLSEKSVYELDVDTLNRKIEEWQESGVQFAGIVHSHMLGQNTLSSGDKEYINLLFSNLPEWMDELYFPVVIPEQRTINVFVIKNNRGKILIDSCEINIV